MAEDKERRIEQDSEGHLSARGKSSSTEPSGSQDVEQNLPLPEEVLTDVPREDRQAIFRAFSSVTQFAGPVFNPIFQKVTSKHVSQIIDNIESDSVREHKARASHRKYQFLYFILGLISVVGLIVFFVVSDKENLALPIITAVTGFLGGFLAGQRFRN